MFILATAIHSFKWRKMVENVKFIVISYVIFNLGFWQVGIKQQK